MSINDAIIVHGAVETDCAVLNDLVEEIKCSKCGQVIRGAAGVTLTSVLNISASEKATCPFCGTTNN